MNYDYVICVLNDKIYDLKTMRKYSIKMLKNGINVYLHKSSLKSSKQLIKSLKRAIKQLEQIRKEAR